MGGRRVSRGYDPGLSWDDLEDLGFRPTEFVMSTAGLSLAAAQNDKFDDWLRVAWAANLKLGANGHANFSQGQLRRIVYGANDGGKGENIGRVIQRAIDHGALEPGSWWGCLQPVHTGNGRRRTYGQCARCEARDRRAAKSKGEAAPQVSGGKGEVPRCVSTPKGEAVPQVSAEVFHLSASVSDSAAPPPRSIPTGATA